MGNQAEGLLGKPIPFCRWFLTFESVDTILYCDHSNTKWARFPDNPILHTEVCIWQSFKWLKHVSNSSRKSKVKSKTLTKFLSPCSFTSKSSSARQSRICLSKSTFTNQLMCVQAHSLGLENEQGSDIFLSFSTIFWATSGFFSCAVAELLRARGYFQTQSSLFFRWSRVFLARNPCA